jgi:hypothetical protein
MKSAQVPDQLTTGPKVQVIRITQNDLRADVPQMHRRERFYRALRSNGHEDRRLNFTVPSLQSPAAGSSGRIRFKQLKVIGHVLGGHHDEA